MPNWTDSKRVINVSFILYVSRAKEKIGAKQRHEKAKKKRHDKMALNVQTCTNNICQV